MEIVEAVHEARARDLLTDDSINSDIWIFGFGSLIHNPGFEYAERRLGYIRGWRRVWYQGSTDHRGTPDNPGRTVTLEADATAVTWGAAFKLAGTPQEQHKTLAWLEWREKQYDLREKVDVYPPSSFSPSSSEPPTSEPVVHGALCYIATSCGIANPNYLGPAPLDVIARQVAISIGPSGANSEYLFKLADALREIPGATDEELFVLEAHVKSLEAEAATGGEVFVDENKKTSKRTSGEEDFSEDAGGAIENSSVAGAT
ncbi:hypothetical protein Ndes2526A_g07889 [Nannochloris sp. 'desiccata']|nr:hypothetical protein KSW81_002636 [Chlorella desiccata (nom. nud.)]